MRFVFISLVLLNLLLLTWRYAVGLPEHLTAVEPPIGENEQELDGVSRLALLSETTTIAERTGGNVGAQEKREPVVVAAAAQDPATSMCKLVGPFASTARANQFLDRIESLDLKAAVQTLEVPAGASHWVLSPREKTEKAARRTLAELKARGVDTYIIPRGDLQNRISLGVFRRLERAEKLHRQLTRKSVKAEIISVERTQEEMWVAFGMNEESKIDQNTWQKLVVDEFSLQEQEKFCLAVASKENFH